MMCWVYFMCLIYLFDDYFNILLCSFYLAIRCPPPVAPINGRVVDMGRHLAGDFVQYTCNAGHVVVGEPVAVCTDHGVWSHPTPTCKYNIYIKICIALKRKKKEKEIGLFTNR